MTGELLGWLRGTLRDVEADATFYLERADEMGREWLQLVLAEVDVQRRILDEAERDMPDSVLLWLARNLAAAHANHPGYRPEWRP